MAFRVGQRVECIDGEFLWVASTPFLTLLRRTVDPVKGARYVIDGVDKAGEMLSIVGFADAIYTAENFRPLVDDEFARLAALAEKPPKALVRALQPAGVV